MGGRSRKSKRSSSIEKGAGDRKQEQQDDPLLLPTAPAPVSYLPRMIQSPCDVPMNNNIGSDNQALVLDAMNA